MATKAIFVGINKHLDTTIPELSGARRDATALWALFTDTVDGLTARLLVDDRNDDCRVDAGQAVLPDEAAYQTETTSRADQGTCLLTVELTVSTDDVISQLSPSET